MKKWHIFSMIIAMLFLAGCQNVVVSENESPHVSESRSQSSSNEPKEIVDLPDLLFIENSNRTSVGLSYSIDVEIDTDFTFTVVTDSGSCEIYIPDVLEKHKFSKPTDSYSVLLPAGSYNVKYDLQHFTGSFRIEPTEAINS